MYQNKIKKSVTLLPNRIILVPPIVPVLQKMKPILIFIQLIKFPAHISLTNTLSSEGHNMLGLEGHNIFRLEEHIAYSPP